MKTSGLLPEECREEIRQRLKGSKSLLKHYSKKGEYEHASRINHELSILKWVLNDREG